MLRCVVAVLAACLIAGAAVAVGAASCGGGATKSHDASTGDAPADSAADGDAALDPPRGTHLYAAPNTGPWATLRDDIELEVTISQPGWGEVRSLPGIRLRRGEAFIPVPGAL